MHSRRRERLSICNYRKPEEKTRQPTPGRPKPQSKPTNATSNQASQHPKTWARATALRETGSNAFVVATNVVVAAIDDTLKRVVTGSDNEVKLLGECHVPCVPLRKSLRLRRQYPSPVQPGRELTGPIEVLDTRSESRHPLRESGVPMAQDGGREEGDSGEDGADGRADRATHEVDVVAVAAREALVPVREARAWRVAVVAGAREEEVEEAAQGALEEKFVFGCQQPEGGGDEQEEVFEGDGVAPMEDEA